MMFPAVKDWDDAYTNGAHIAQGDTYPARWAEAAEGFRREMTAGKRARLDLAYAPLSRNKLDLFLPEAPPRGLFVFVHGGYWMRFDKSSWSHLARGAIERGLAVAMPAYTLCPEIRIGGIVREISAAISFAAKEIDGPVFLAGHSAGGHLVSRMLAVPGPLDDNMRRRIVHVVSISGLHDLRPIMKTAMNATLKIDQAEASAESPCLLEPHNGTRLTCWVGATERAEFVRQNALLANVWRGLGAETAEVIEDNRHHFNIIDGLADAVSPLATALFET